MYALKVLSYWWIWKVANFAIEQTSSIFRWRLDFFVRIKLLPINIFLTNQSRIEKLTSFHFRKFAVKAAIFKTITTESHLVFMKGQSLKVPYSAFPARWINCKSHAITLVLWAEYSSIDVNYLDRVSVRWINCPVKMATGHFPTGSHNFAQCGVIDHDQIATVTLKT